jgi:Transposase.
MPRQPGDAAECADRAPGPVPVQAPSGRVDNFAIRHGRRYGTVLVAVESHDVLNLLPGREK